MLLSGLLSVDLLLLDELSLEELLFAGAVAFDDPEPLDCFSTLVGLDPLLDEPLSDEPLVTVLAAPRELELEPDFFW